jgi:hypothetical protein
MMIAATITSRAPCARSQWVEVCSASFMTTIRKLKFAWKYRRPLWKYRRLIRHRKAVAGGAALAGAAAAAWAFASWYRPAESKG